MSTCVSPLHPADPMGARCGKPAVAVRIVFGLPAANYCAEHAAEIDRIRGHGPSAEEKALTRALTGAPAHENRDALRRVLVDLRVACDDADTVVQDMLRSPRRRELGPVLHQQNYREAREKIVSALAYLFRLVSDDGERGDPSGNGGSPVH